MRKIRRAAQLTLSDWCYFAKASVELLVARFRFSTVPPERILRELQQQSVSLPHERASRSSAIDVERVSWAITLAARYVPWRSDCLIQVMGADRWLRMRGFKAHAWLRYRDLTVTGGRYDEFVPLIEPRVK
jgi:hypothetical protein